MLNTSRILLWTGPLLGAAFLLSLLHLFQLRYTTGDVYPPYSSLRADPLGVKALYESYGRLSGMEVRRNLRPLETGADLPPAGFFLLGFNAGQLSRLSEPLVQEWERLARLGGRVVIALAPESERPWRPRVFENAPGRRTAPRPHPAPPESEEPSEEEPAMPRPQRRDQPRDESPDRFVSLERRWGFKSDYERLPQTAGGDSLPVSVHRTWNTPVPDVIPWHTALFFDGLDPSWRVVYAREAKAVLIERDLGRGSVVLSADSYFLSNQAMRQDCYPQLLAWLAGSHSTLVFDETHLGIMERPGVASLARKYRLHGVLAGLLLVAGLFIWKSSYSLVPPASSRKVPVEDGIGGRDSASGLINLLRRTVGPGEILFACYNHWKASGGQQVAGHSPSKLERMQALVAQEQARPAKQRQPVETYQTLTRILAEKN